MRIISLASFSVNSRCSVNQWANTSEGTCRRRIPDSRPFVNSSFTTISFAMATIISRFLAIKSVRQEIPKGLRNKEVTPNQSATPPTAAAKDI